MRLLFAYLFYIVDHTVELCNYLACPSD